MDYAAARRHMVDSQVSPNGITDRRILGAMAIVPREKFVPADTMSLAYMDGDLALSGASSPRALISPMVLARMLQLTQIGSDGKMLIIGGGSGYSAMVAAQLAREVVVLESDPLLVASARSNLQGIANISIVEGPLSSGYVKLSLYNAILIEGVAEVVPDGLAAQLTEDGRLVAIKGCGTNGRLAVAMSEQGQLSWRFLNECAAPSLPGFKGEAAGFVF